MHVWWKEIKKFKSINRLNFKRGARDSSETDDPVALKLDTDTLSEHLNGKNSYLKRII